jgi:hypothetical protein
MNDNQNYFVTRSTSRVLNIPGGKCSIDIFGGDDDHKKSSSTAPPPAAPSNDNSKPPAASPTAQANNEALKNKQRAMGDSFDLFGGDEPNSKSNDAPKNSTKPQQPVEKPISSNQFASAQTTNSYNVITARPTSRVLQEPGGKSEDFIFG